MPPRFARQQTSFHKPTLWFAPPSWPPVFHPGKVSENFNYKTLAKYGPDEATGSERTPSWTRNRPRVPSAVRGNWGGTFSCLRDKPHSAVRKAKNWRHSSTELGERKRTQRPLLLNGECPRRRGKCCLSKRQVGQLKDWIRPSPSLASMDGRNTFRTIQESLENSKCQPTVLSPMVS